MRRSLRPSGTFVWPALSLGQRRWFVERHDALFLVLRLRTASSQRSRHDDGMVLWSASRRTPCRSTLFSAFQLLVKYSSTRLGSRPVTAPRVSNVVLSREHVPVSLRPQSAAQLAQNGRERHQDGRSTTGDRAPKINATAARH
ncbi:hypothetical protein DIS24_g11528 [Lasiodiplodia hormozganensis]|uniref:Uncharacterized protein n=1 Tax=Lasiodiplodia hormozganensis TaxID=869390 RepID=A0AA39WNP3_9PEZI|nr:hypothetical protein DIS24_g11528 [Lasiodiplodia hormozganensis]